MEIILLSQAIGIVMGANIGTTFSSQLIALDIGRFSPIAMVIGLLFSMLAKSERVSKSGKVILYFGILFFGLFTMETAVEPLKSDSRFAEWMVALENPVRGSLVGALVTLIIQSSSATVGMVITLAKKGLITLAGSIAVMLGAELGNCSDTLLATIRGSRQAIRTGHCAYVVQCLWGNTVPSFYPVCGEADGEMDTGQGEGSRQKKDAQTGNRLIFNPLILVFNKTITCCPAGFLPKKPLSLQPIF